MMAAQEKLSKGNTQVCIDCEFRYICTYYRSYWGPPKDILSMPQQGGYIPCTGEWSTKPLSREPLIFMNEGDGEGEMRCTQIACDLCRDGG